MRVPTPRASGRRGLSVRELVLVALLASLGGAMSPYISYLGNLVNRVLGVPFGAGQILAGLHVVWPLLAGGLVRRAGAATLTGAVKGVVEFLLGNPHGVVVIVVSGVQGVFSDLGLSLDRGGGRWSFLLAGAVAASSNVFVFQALYFSGVQWGYILGMAGLAACSGLVLGGWLAWDLLVSLRRAGLAPASQLPRTRRRWWALGLAGALLAGGAFFWWVIYQPPLAPGTLKVGGRVENPFLFRYQEWEAHQVTLSATLEGAVTYVPPRPYTGVPVRLILARARPHPQASRLIARASDGFSASFPLPQVLAGDDLLLVREGEGLRLVARGHPGSKWVQGVVLLEVQ